MRWLLQWLVEDILRLFGVPVTENAELREKMVRQRQRKRYHSAELTDAQERLSVHRRRVQVLERSADTPRDELVSARRELVDAEGDVRHHEARLHQARVELEDLQATRRKGEPDRDGGHEPDHDPDHDEDPWGTDTGAADPPGFGEDPFSEGEDRP